MNFICLRCLPARWKENAKDACQFKKKSLKRRISVRVGQLSKSATYLKVTSLASISQDEQEMARTYVANHQASLGGQVSV